MDKSVIKTDPGVEKTLDTVIPLPLVGFKCMICTTHVYVRYKLRPLWPSAMCPCLECMTMDDIIHRVPRLKKN